MKVPDTLAGIGFMVKDSKRFPDTGGWGYAQFDYDPASDTFTPNTTLQGNDAKCGVACHTLAEAKDFVFTSLGSGERGTGWRRSPPFVRRDWQVVMAAFLWHVGGREIDGDGARRQSEAGSDQRRVHAFARLRDRLVPQTDDMKGGKARRHLHLDIDRAGLDALKCYSGTR